LSPLQHETVVSLLAGLDWFSSLTQEELDGLARGARTLEWEPDQIVFEEGERGDECFVLQSGAVKVLRRFPDGRRITLARLSAGSVVGELALFNGERRSASVQATEPTIAVALAGSDVMGILRTDPEAALSVAITLADRLRAANERLFEHALATVAGRVAATLLAQVEARLAQGAKSLNVEVVGNSTDIARLAGASREAATRVMHWLENEGVITMKRGKTIVHDPDALSKHLS
jgi:CRP/FNR family transcriptional regulator, cyclic AMP receptor protein